MQQYLNCSDLPSANRHVTEIDGRKIRETEILNVHPIIHPGGQPLAKCGQRPKKCGQHGKIERNDSFKNSFIIVFQRKFSRNLNALKDISTINSL
jgi:hypothetical protein